MDIQDDSVSVIPWFFVTGDKTAGGHGWGSHMYSIYSRGDHVTDNNPTSMVGRCGIGLKQVVCKFKILVECRIGIICAFVLDVDTKGELRFKFKIKQGLLKRPSVQPFWKDEIERLIRLDQYAYLGPQAPDFGSLCDCGR